MTTVLVLVVTAFGQAAPVDASEPDPPCEWTHFGYDSTCDGKILPDPPCHYVLPSSAYEVYIGEGVWVSLLYARGGGQCRTVLAHIVAAWDPLPAGSNCYVKIERNYRDPGLGDNDRIYAGLIPGFVTEAYTRELYDAGVSSYAYGYCAIPGRDPVSGRTPNY